MKSIHMVMKSVFLKVLKRLSEFHVAISRRLKGISKATPFMPWNLAQASQQGGEREE